MSKAFRCDRCRRYEDDDPVAGVSLNRPNAEAQPGSSARTIDTYELCAPCLAELRDWIREGRAPADLPAQDQYQ